MTIKDIAQAVGVSTAAVSLALRNSPRISVGRRAEIRAVADHLGYAKNSAISALMVNRSTKRQDPGLETIAWLVGNRESKSPDGATASKHTRQVLKGINDEAAERGYQLCGFSLDECDEEGKDLHKILVSRGIRGVILGPETNTDRVLPLEFEHFCSIGISNFHSSIPVNRVMTNYYESAQLAISRITAQGSKRIALVYPQYINPVSNYMFEAVYSMYRQQNPRIPNIDGVFYDSIADVDWVRWYIAAKPEGLICYQPEIPEILRQSGVRIPEDLQVVLIAADGPELDGLTYASCGSNSYQGGRLVMSSLADDLCFNRVGLPSFQKWILVKPEWYPGNSIRMA